MLIRSHSSFLQQFIVVFGFAFDLKDLGDLNIFLSLQVQRSSSGLHISQAKYALDLLKCANIVECKPSSTHVAIKLAISAHSTFPYRISLPSWLLTIFNAHATTHRFLSELCCTIHYCIERTLHDCREAYSTICGRDNHSWIFSPTSNFCLYHGLLRPGLHMMH